MHQVVCIGSASQDILFPIRGAHIIEGSRVEEKKLIAFEYGAKHQVEDRYEALGGVAANCSHAMAKLGLTAACYSRLGHDQIGRWITEELERAGVNTRLLQIDDQRASDLSVILVDMQNGERTIFFNRDANENLQLDPDTFTSQWILASALNGNWQSNINALLNKIKEDDLNFAYNPGQANIKEDCKKIREVISLADLVVLNRDEAIEIVSGGKDEIDLLFGELKKIGVKNIAITDGTRGAYANDRGTILHADALSVKTVETTGAGDAFCAAFLAALIKGKSVEECLQWGVAHGAETVKYFGAVQGHLTLEDLEEKAARVSVRTISKLAV